MLIYLQMVETEDDGARFQEIFRAYGALMYHVAYRRLRSEQDAEDAVHDAFVKIAKNVKRILPPCPQTKQLVVLIVNSCVTDMLRSRGRHPTVPYDDVRPGVVPCSEPEGENLLAACINALPEAQRAVICLRYVQGYNHREIADMLGKTLAWVQKTDQRAKQRLKELYIEGGGTI